jgi:hypothetical protein
MARKKRKTRQLAAARIPVSDEEVISRLQEDAPEVLGAKIPEATFDATVGELLKESPLGDEVPHFYCRKCGEYHLKTHPHYSRRSQPSLD